MPSCICGMLVMFFQRFPLACFGTEAAGYCGVLFAGCWLSYSGRLLAVGLP